MSGLGDFADKAKKMAREHPEQVDKVADKVQDFAQDRTGHRHDEQIDRGVDSAQRFYGGNADDPERGA